MEQNKVNFTVKSDWSTFRRGKTWVQYDCGALAKLDRTELLIGKPCPRRKRLCHNCPSNCK